MVIFKLFVICLCLFCGTFPLRLYSTHSQCLGKCVVITKKASVTEAFFDFPEGILEDVAQTAINFVVVDIAICQFAHIVITVSDIEVQPGRDLG